MATSTTTIRTTTTCTFGACAAESDRLYSFRSLHEAYVLCRRRKRNTINALRPDYVLVRNRVIGNLRARLRQFHDEMVQQKGSVPEHNIIHLREENLRQLRQTLASYLGHFKHANAFRLIRSLFEKYRYLKGFKAKALNAGVPYVVVGERGYYHSGLKKRVVTEIFKVTPPGLPLTQGEDKISTS